MAVDEGVDSSIAKETTSIIEELTPRPDTPPDRTTLRFIPDLDVLVPSPKLKSSKSGIDLRAVRSGGVSGLGVSSSMI